WKESGRVPAEKRQPLWDEFSKLNNRIFSKLKRAAQNTPTISPGNLIRKIEKMNSEMKSLADAPFSPENLATAKRLQAEWKNLPKRKPREVQQSSRSFVFSMDVVFEKAFLNRLAHSKFQDFDQKEPKEQSQIKISILRDLIGR